MKKITGAQGAFIVRILMESMQSMRAAGKRLLEAGFTGERKDKLGHTRYYRDGRQVKNPNAQEKASIKAAAGQPLPAGQAPSHNDAATRVNALAPDTPPQQVKALANDLMQMDTKDLEKMAQAPAVPTPAETKAAATAEKATTSGNKKGIGTAGDLVNISTDDIHVDPHRFQYKQKLDSTTGAGDNLKNVNTFNSLFAGVIHAWKDPADGKVYVVNGHHRMELARRAGHKKMNVQMILAPDAATARSTGALINMAEGRGTALDAAKFLRESGQSIEDLKGHGVSLREKVVDNAVQLKGLSDRIFNDLSSGRLDEDKAVAIGRHLKDHNEQEQLYNHYLEQREKNNKEFSASTLDQAAQDLAKAPKQKGGGQMDLFGNTDDGKSLFLEKAELKSKIRAALTQEVNDYSVAGNARRAKNIASAGNVLQVEKNKELSKQADRIKQAFEQFQHLSGPLSDAINAHVEEYANVKGSKRAIVEKALADVRSAIQEIIDGGSQSNLRAGSQNSQSDQRAGGTGQADLPGDVRGGNAQDVGPSLFGNTQDDQPSAPAASKADEPGFTGIDAEGREWRNGELVAKQEEPKTPAAPAPAPAAGMNPETLALDALRLKGNRKPHNAAHITPDAVAGLKAKGLIDDAGKITDKGREQLYAAKNKALRKATGPKAATPATAPAAPTDLGADADALEALRLKANKKQHVAGHITPDAIASLKKQGFIDDNNKLTPEGRAHLAAKKGSQEIAAINASNDSVKPMPTSGEKYFGTGGEHAVVTLKNGKKGIIPPPMENVPGWKEYEERNYPNGPIPAKSFYGLTESEVVEHREAQELIRREWPKFRQEYLAKMGTFDPETGELISITCNCDDWRDQFPNYVGTNSGTIHDAASYANMRMLNEAMALMKGKGNNQFLVLGGGGGSGKGTATKDILKAGDYPVVLDSVSDDSQWTKELMDMAKSHGYGGQFVFIDRAPQDAWKDGVVKRAMESRAKFNAGDKTSLARTVPLSVAVPANLKARRAAFELLEDGQVPTMIINNNLGFGKAREVVGEEAAAYLQNGINSYNKEQLLKELEDDTYGLYESGKIPDDIAKGLITSKTIETRRLQLRSVGGSNSERPSDGRGTNTNPQGVSDQAPMDGATSQGTSSAGKSGQGEVDDLLARHLQRQGFTGIDAQGREWRNGELVAKKDEPAAKPEPAPAPAEQLQAGPDDGPMKMNYFTSNAEIPQWAKDAGYDKRKLKKRGLSQATVEKVEDHANQIIRSVATFIESPEHAANHLKKTLLYQVGISGGMDSALKQVAHQYWADSQRQHWNPNSGPNAAKIAQSIENLRTDLQSKLNALQHPAPATPTPNTDLFGNATKPTPKGPETMPGLFGNQVPVAPDAPTPTAGEPLPGSDNPLDRPGAGRGKEDGTQDMFGLFGPGTKAKVDAINNGPDPVTEPTTPAPEPATTQPEPEKSNKAPGVKANDVPYDLAYNAHYGTSFVPEKRAKQRQQDYVNQMQADWEHLSKFAKTPEQKNILRDEFDRYKAGYLSKYKTALHAHSRTMSTMIAGPSKFPTSRNRKAIDSADKRSQEVEEFRERALRAAAKAINPELSGSPVLSRDANAVQTLQAQLDKLTQTQELMKKMNAAYKKFLKNPDSLATSGLSEKLQQSIRKFHDAPDASQRWSWHKNPFPAYQLTNNGANIRRIQKRIDELQKMKAQPEQEIKYSGNVTVEHDPEGARIRVKFPGKPSPEVIKKIKSKGFVWSPTNGAWQRQLNNASIYATDSLMQELGHVKEAVMPDPHAEKIKLVQAIIARRGIKPPQPKAPPATKKTPEASGDADPRVKRIRELMDAYC